MTPSLGAPTSTVAEAAADGRLPRRLGGWSTAAVTIGIMIGSGIFRVPAGAAAATGTPVAMLLTWVVGGLVAMCGALALAEVAALFPNAGGMYVYLREAYGPLTAFLFGWLYLFVIPTGASAIALVFAEYLGRLVPTRAGPDPGVATLVILLLAAAQYRSGPLRGRDPERLHRREGAGDPRAERRRVPARRTRRRGVGRRPGSRARELERLRARRRRGALGVQRLAGRHLSLGRGARSGPGAAARDRGRHARRRGDLPAGQMRPTSAFSRSGRSRSPLVAADLAVRLVGPAGSALIAALVCVSTFGALDAVIMAIPRVFWAMADDGLFFRTVAAVHPRYRTPHMAIVALAGLAIVYLVFRTFEQLIEAFVLASLPFWALGVASVIVLRRRRPELPRVYRTPGYPLVPLLFVAAIAALVANSLWEHPESTATSLAAVAAGVPVYYAWRRFGTRG